jgi:hypothetical protein
MAYVGATLNSSLPTGCVISSLPTGCALLQPCGDLETLQPCGANHRWAAGLFQPSSSRRCDQHRRRICFCLVFDFAVALARHPERFCLCRQGAWCRLCRRSASCCGSAALNGAVSADRARFAAALRHSRKLQPCATPIGEAPASSSRLCLSPLASH